MLELEIPETLSDKVVDFTQAPLNGGIQLRVQFTNGWGASVVSHSFSYGGLEGLYELAVLDDLGHLNYDTPITDDVLGHLERTDVYDLLFKIAALNSDAMAEHHRRRRAEELFNQFWQVTEGVCRLAGHEGGQDPVTATDLPFELRTAVRAIENVYKARLAQTDE